MKTKVIEEYIEKNLFTVKKHDKEIAEKSLNFINKLRNAFSTNSNIKIYSDYDTDGISSAVMLKELIEDYAKAKKVKANLEVLIPSRESGYGLTIETFEELQKDGSYVFTLDNGTHRNFLSKIPNECKDRVFIIDHHPNGDSREIPYVLNPNKDGSFIISTAYLVDYMYEVMIQLDKEFGKTADRYKYADLVSLSLISDMADLNNYRVRFLINKGLEAIAKKERLLFQFLFPKKDTQITYNNIAFDINPLINSIGRLSSNPVDAVTIMGLKKNTERGTRAIAYIKSVNELRKNLLNKFADEALENVAQNKDKYKNLIFYYNSKIPLGLNGLIAQKINEVYDMPVLVASDSKKGITKGSGRGFNIKYLLNMFNDKDALSYGGHNEALGFEVKDFALFNNMIERANRKVIKVEREFKNIILDGKFTLDEYIDFSRSYSKRINTVPFKQKLYVELKDTTYSIRREFKNNFCLLEVKDSSGEKLNYFTKTNIAKEIVENKEKFFISMYAEFNNKKIVQDYSGDIILEKNIKKPDIYVEKEPDLYLYQ